MKSLTPGKLRSFQQSASPKDTFTCLALDHRQNLRKLNPDYVIDENLCKFKLDITDSLAEYSTAVLMDPEVSAGQAVTRGVMPGDKGLILALEATGYTGDSTARTSQLLAGWSVEKAKRFGASMVKLLVYYHPNSPTSNEIEQFVKGIALDCKRFDIALMLEVLTYSPTEKKLVGGVKKKAIIESARILSRIDGVDLLKMELPQDVFKEDQGLLLDACKELSDASLAPWILLSASVPYEKFFSQARIACLAGASGVAVGRAVWQEAVNLGELERFKFLNETGKERMARLKDLCSETARPWTDYYQGELDFGWYKQYEGFD